MRSQHGALPVLGRAYAHGFGHRRTLRSLAPRQSAPRLGDSRQLTSSAGSRRAQQHVGRGRRPPGTQRIAHPGRPHRRPARRPQVPVDGVERVLVFGSWACRHLGEPGPTPRDIDVLVLGTPDDYPVTSVCLDLSGQYGVEVSPMIVSSNEFVTRGRNPYSTRSPVDRLLRCVNEEEHHPVPRTAPAGQGQVRQRRSRGRMVRRGSAHLKSARLVIPRPPPA